ncbi:lipoprotein LpqH [Williamsia muralis]|uniref:lipoprotein LpqH n=1 Tax=Williamsia marianensis TaxID=85044 RepID=UPI0038223F49
MKRVLTATLGLIASATLLMACSDDSSSNADSSPAANPVATSPSNGTEVSTGGDTEVKVEGKDLAGVDLNSVSCVKQGGKINVGSGSTGGQQGLGIVMTDEATPKVESLGLVVDGNALAVTNGMGMSVGSAKVSVDGDTYTITGEAEGADMKNPTAGMIKKEFSIKVSCN